MKRAETLGEKYLENKNHYKYWYLSRREGNNIRNMLDK